MTADEIGRYGDLGLTVVIGIAFTVVGFRSAKPKPPHLFKGLDAVNKARKAAKWGGPLIVAMGVWQYFERTPSAPIAQNPSHQWKTFHSKSGEFSLKFPEEVLEETTNQIVTGTANVLTVHRAKFTDQGRDIFFSASHRDPAPGVKAPLEAVAAALAQQFGNPTIDRPVTLGGREGRELVFHTHENYTGTWRYFPDGDGLTWITVVAPDRYAGDADVTTFLSSFQFDTAIKR